MSSAAVSIAGLSHRYGERLALDDLTLEVATREMFGLLGPNGGGKTTLFRVLSTLLPLQKGAVQVLGFDVAGSPAAIRSEIGVTFQSPGLDRKLTVLENLRHQGHLYGLAGRELRRKIDALLEQLGLTDRLRDRVESLSGGLARRVEVAKGLLHDPRLLLLDEPGTGLDPGARVELWRTLRTLRDEAGVTVVATTHLMDEAERCDRLAILDRGRLAALGTPDELRRAVGGDCLMIDAPDAPALARELAERFSLKPQIVDGQLRIESERGHVLLGTLVEAFGPRIASITLGKPTLEDVFVQRTGRRFSNEGE